ncbi:hypothetical protein SeLEV6574_g01968 [Synchytrium endobioticum]|uniref:Uncharacterized protein n=1 Tax=Synchytrium endobioticum TaxID=286115 RepID=A0A507DB01_9FUNG|nr:hypothetical protein SeLEV6574_g01968 [Synchytrium endobioticum]
MTSKATGRKQSLSTTTVSTDRTFIPLNKSFSSVGEFVREIEKSLSTHNHIYIFNDEYDDDNRSTLVSKKSAIGKLEYCQAVVKSNDHNGHAGGGSGISPSKRSNGTPPTDHEDNEYYLTSDVSPVSSSSATKERPYTPTSKSPTHIHSAKHDSHDHDGEHALFMSVTGHPIKDLSGILVKLSRSHDETTMIIRSFVREVRYGKESSGNIECREEPCICEIGDECHLDRLHEIRGYKITRLSSCDKGEKGGKVECCPMRTEEVKEFLQVDLAPYEFVY